MSFTPGMADSQGEFAEVETLPKVPCRKCGVHAVTERKWESVPCRKCGVHAVTERKWESSCGGWEDYQFKCNACGHSWWVEGIDS